MTDLFIECARNANILQLFAIGLMFWFFYNRLDKKRAIDIAELKADISKVDAELRADISRIDNVLSTRIDKLSEKIEDAERRLGEKVDDVDRRLWRIEGSLASHGHCLFQQREEKKAE
jgi:hypothetical protein